MKSYGVKLVLFAQTSPRTKMMQVCNFTKSTTLLHQRCQQYNRQKWTITAQNNNAKIIASSSDETKWLNYRWVNNSNCRKNWSSHLVYNYS